MRLGTPFKDFDQATPLQVEVAERIADPNAANGGPVDAKVAASDRARVRTAVAREFSGPSTAGIRSMPGSWPGRSPKTHAPAPVRSPVMT